jgi:hypothetical protein
MFCRKIISTISFFYFYFQNLQDTASITQVYLQNKHITLRSLYKLANQFLDLNQKRHAKTYGERRKPVESYEEIMRPVETYKEIQRPVEERVHFDILIFGFGIVSTVWYLLFYIFILYLEVQINLSFSKEKKY